MPCHQSCRRSMIWMHIDWNKLRISGKIISESSIALANRYSSEWRLNIIETNKIQTFRSSLSWSWTSSYCLDFKESSRRLGSSAVSFPSQNKQLWRLSDKPLQFEEQLPVISLALEAEASRYHVVKAHSATYVARAALKGFAFLPLANPHGPAVSGFRLLNSTKLRLKKNSEHGKLDFPIQMLGVRLINPELGGGFWPRRVPFVISRLGS